MPGRKESCGTNCETEVKLFLIMYFDMTLKLQYFFPDALGGYCGRFAK